MASKRSVCDWAAQAGGILRSGRGQAGTEGLVLKSKILRIFDLLLDSRILGPKM